MLDHDLGYAFLFFAFLFLLFSKLLIKRVHFLDVLLFDGTVMVLGAPRGGNIFVAFELGFEHRLLNFLDSGSPSVFEQLPKFGFDSVDVCPDCRQQFFLFFKGASSTCFIDTLLCVDALKGVLNLLLPF